MPKRPDPIYTPSNAGPPDTPLAILLTRMREKYAARDYDGAEALARVAAPYVHPRVPASTPPSDLATMPDADLDTLHPSD